MNLIVATTPARVYVCVCVCVCIQTCIPSLGTLNGGLHGIFENLKEGVVEVGWNQRRDRPGALVDDINWRDALQEVVLADAVDLHAAVCVYVCVCM